MDLVLSRAGMPGCSRCRQCRPSTLQSPPASASQPPERRLLSSGSCHEETNARLTATIVTGRSLSTCDVVTRAARLTATIVTGENFDLGFVT